MHDFVYKNNELYCEDIKVADIAKEIGTPFFLYSYNTIKDHFTKYQKAFKEIDPLICYSVKACSNLTVLKELVSLGAGLDIVSGGELFRALKAGCEPSKIVYAGVGKTEPEIRYALENKIKMFNVESYAELDVINQIAKDMNVTAEISLRVNPDVDPKTHTYITTGKKENKFGLDFDMAYNIFLKSANMKNVCIKGIHCHIGSQITQAQPFADALDKLDEFLSNLRNSNFDIEILNLGGGLGIIYDEEKPQTPKEFADFIVSYIKKLNVHEIIFEPGRFIVGNAGILVTQVQYLKDNSEKLFVIVDAGMNDLIRPTLYQAYHKIDALKLKDEKIICDVVGPICESGDYFAKERQLTQVRRGDLMAIFSAGAYGFTMSSNYNSRRRSAEVLVKDGSFRVIRQRETYEDLVKGE
ncbi:diaminopimelate decarboxylase [bacterium]|nr:diaminopimelate decarboxylase [bacterium]